MIAQHFAQGLVHEVSDAVVAHGGGAARGIDLRLHGIAYLEHALCEHTVMAVHAGLDFLRVGHIKHHAGGGEPAGITHLATAFGVERRSVEHDHAGLPRFQFVHAGAIGIQRNDAASVVGHFLVAGKNARFAFVFEQLIHLELAGGAGSVFLLLHGGVKASHVHRHAALAAHVLRQIKREAVGVVQFEGHVAG